MPPLPVVTYREMIRILKQRGWVQVRQKGSHRRFEHPTLPGAVTIAGHDKEDLHPKTLKSILAQAGMSAEELSS